MLRQRLLTSPAVRCSTPAIPRAFHTMRPSPLRPTTAALPSKFSVVNSQSRVLATSANQKPIPRRSALARGAIKTLAFCGFASLTITGVVVAFFIYDASTYKEQADESDIGVPELALNPRRGGPKNLPIAEALLDDDDGEAARQRREKPRLVVLGCGWGSVSLLKSINPDNYNVTVISPTNYFLYTPLLPSATVGTLEIRSLIEPIRRITGAIKGSFLKANAENVDFSEKLVEVSQTLSNGEKRYFYVPYDKLVIGVGSKTRTHGVEGLEHVEFLKNLNDARRIRSKVIENLEQACLPTTTDEERKRLLSFVVCGGGPTGVEFAAELYDMLNEDLTLRYPRMLRNEISVHVVQSRSHILNTYDETLSKFAEERFARNEIDVLTNSRVSRIEREKVIFTQQDENGRTITKELPFGMCLWSTGVAQTDFSQKIADSLETQKNTHALETDSHLRLLGTPLGDVYAIGDCSTVQNHITSHITEFLEKVAWENGIKDEKSMQLSFSQWRILAPRIRKRFPQTIDHLRRLDKLFEKYDEDRSGTLDFQELTKLLEQIDAKLTSLPATAQRAHQQGQYLARKLNKLAQAAPGMEINQVVDGDLDETVYKAFKYEHMGSMAYLGNSAVFDFNGMSFGGGLVFLYLWRSVYFAQSVSARTRMLLAMDWTKRALFGRDLMNF